MVQDILEVDSPVLAGISGGLESEAEPVEELMTLKYPNEDTGSVIMEYMDSVAYLGSEFCTALDTDSALLTFSGKKDFKFHIKFIKSHLMFALQYFRAFQSSWRMPHRNFTGCVSKRTRKSLEDVIKEMEERESAREQEAVEREEKRWREKEKKEERQERERQEREDRQLRTKKEKKGGAGKQIKGRKDCLTCLS
ncbi:hypothetical protein ROHU_001114 [Labeo rohita]|uniref:Uncharacterized protein n=1 Tax=Labeo rohita TaxID=84645 RepID=A0A498P1E9_LABRO|nr:hypothetical protein ROHU_001114 [Labeo rohita]